MGMQITIKSPQTKDKHTTHYFNPKFMNYYLKKVFKMACTTHVHFMLGFNSSQEIRLKECTVVGYFIGYICVSHCCLAVYLKAEITFYVLMHVISKRWSLQQLSLKLFMTQASPHGFTCWHQHLHGRLCAWICTVDFRILCGVCTVWLKKRASGFLLPEKLTRDQCEIAGLTILTSLCGSKV